MYGLARTTEKARTLAAEESKPRVYTLAHPDSDRFVVNAVMPIIGDASNPDPWISIVAELDTVIDVVATSDLKGMGASLLAAISEAAQKYRPHGAPKL